MIVIGEYNADTAWPVEAWPVKAEKKGKAYMLFPASPEMDKKGWNDINNAFREKISPEGNISRPVEIIRAEGNAFSVEKYIPSVLDGYDLRLFRTLGAPHRQRIILCALRALQTMHEASLVHGSLDTDRIRVTVSGDGSFRSIIAGLGFACTGNNPKAGYRKAFAAPECVNNTCNKKTDVYAMGICIYFWLTCEYPFRDKNGTVLLPDSMSEFYRNMIAAMLQPDPGKRASLEEILTYTDKKEASTLPSAEYALFRDDTAYRDNLDEMPESLHKRIPEYTINFRSRKVDSELW